MGSKKKPTIGYWYKLALHFGAGKGPIDALLEFRGGDKTAWSGEQTTSGVISVNALNLWGGEKAEGGIAGQLHVMMGDAAQAPNSALTVFGGQNPAYRGKTTFFFTGRYGAFNPYPKPASFKVRRILKGWDGDICWYPEKADVTGAAVPASSPFVWSKAAMVKEGRRVRLYLDGRYASFIDLDYDPNGGFGGYVILGRYRNTSGEYNLDGYLDNFCFTQVARYGESNYTPFIGARNAGNDPYWSQVQINMGFEGTPGTATFTDDKGHAFAAFSGAVLSNAQARSGTCSGRFTGGAYVRTPYSAELNMAGDWTVEIDFRLDNLPSISAVLCCFFQVDSLHSGYALEIGSDGTLGLVIARNGWPTVPVVTTTAFQAGTVVHGMNPAHMLYDSITSADGEGQPIEAIADANWRAAADRFYAEGFGLCTEWDPTKESAEQFQQRILNVVHANISQSREDGLYYLTPVRSPTDLSALPILTDADILEYREEPSDPIESVNQVTVEWFDPERKEKRTTAPIQSLGAIQAAGGILAESSTYPEIGYEDLALRCGARDLSHKSTPLKRFTLTTNRKPYAWRTGQFFRLQAPRRGIADMVCLAGDIGAGTPGSGSMRLRAIQDVSSLPSTVYVIGEPGTDTSPPGTPTPTITQQLVEAPYVDLAGSLTTADLGVLTADAGFALAMAKRPDGGVNYALLTAAGGGTLAPHGFGDFCPTALVVEAGTRDPLQVAFTLSGATDLSEVVVGTAALWGGELCRVDAIDATALTITLGRGCGDTTPDTHAAGTRIWFYDDGSATDNIEYTDGEVVHAKLLTRTATTELALAAATELTVTMDSRQARPYPPARARIDGAAFSGVAKSQTFVVTWAHRDRLLQADQLVDSEAASVGPEANTRYTIQVRNDATNALLLETTDLGVATATVLLTANYAGIRVELFAMRDGLASWQRLTTKPFAYTAGAAGAAYLAANPGSVGVINGTTPAAPDVPLQPYVQKVGDTMTGTLRFEFGATAGAVEMFSTFGTVADMRWGTGAAYRWIARKNALDDLEFQSRNDDGTIRYVEATWARATGVLNFRARPAFGGLPLATQSEIVAGYTAEEAQDAIAALVAAGTHTGVTITYNDGTNSLSFAVSAEFVMDTVAAMIAAGTLTGLTATYNDAGDALNFTVTSAGGSAFVIAAGTADAITATFATAPTLADGLELRVRATAANATTAPTFNPNALGALTIYKLGGQALVAGDIAAAGHELVLRYRASPARYELLNPGSTPASGAAAPTIIADATTARTAVLTDANNVVEFSNAAAVTYTVPPNSAVAFAIGTVLYALQGSTGQITFAPGSGVTFETSDTYKSRAQESFVAMQKTATNKWQALGDLEPATPGATRTQAQNDSLKFAAGAGTGDAMTATLSPVPTLVDGMQFYVRAAGANTLTAPTFNPNGLGALTVFKFGGQALAAGDIYGAGHEIILRYRASPARYELMNPAASGTGGGGGGTTVIQGGASYSNALVVNDTKATTVAGGTPVTGVNTRTLNTTVINNIAGASRSGNQVTLPAGTYRVEARSPCYNCNRTRAYIYNVTDAATALVGESTWAYSGAEGHLFASVEGYITIAATKTFELRHYYTTATATFGLGIPTNDGAAEIYAQLTFWLVDVGGGANVLNKWQSEAITITAVTTNPTKGTILADKVWWRRVGDSMECRYDYDATTAGGSGAGEYFFKIPGGYSMDPAKVRYFTAGSMERGIVGQGICSDHATFTRYIYAVPYDATRFRLSDIVAGPMSSGNMSMGNAKISYAFTITVPILEWA